MIDENVFRIFPLWGESTGGVPLRNFGGGGLSYTSMLASGVFSFLYDVK